MRMAMAGTAALALAILVTACAGEGHWTKEGAPPEQASTDYAQCRAQAQHDIARDVNIDTDIAESRASDWDRSQTTQTHLASDESSDHKLSDDILKGCMEGRGYVPTGAEPNNGPNWWALFDM
ncbi:MAG TPA: hypothetical protein VH020_03745 [Stellaceae bacterium]|jgi:hypothetical protein|nr:hypothetical protein [Stellaceae bacterium]